MEFVIEDTEGRIIGSTDLEGSRWEECRTHFENLQAIVIDITRKGRFGRGYIKSGNGQIEGNINIENKDLDAGSKVIMQPSQITLSVNEQRLDVSQWMSSASTSAVSGRDLGFLEHAIEESIRKAIDLDEHIDAFARTWEISEKAKSLLATLLDLRAIYKSA